VVRTAHPMALAELNLRSQKDTAGYILRFDARVGHRYLLTD
jgi:hypothetical protein